MKGRPMEAKELESKLKVLESKIEELVKTQEECMVVIEEVANGLDIIGTIVLNLPCQEDCDNCDGEDCQNAKGTGLDNIDTLAN